MNDRAKPILDALQLVDGLRTQRRQDASLALRIGQVKSYQADRFANTYRDLLRSPRYQMAAEFFLSELYGPQEFSDRDAQFARVVPSLVRMFPKQLHGVLLDLAALHALSEQMDTAMANRIATATLDAHSYQVAWQQCGRPESRRLQIELTLRIGRALERLTRSRMLRTALRLMRAPAKAANLSALQHVLETGFDAFANMNGAAEFLSIVEEREVAFAKGQFAQAASI